MVHALRQKVAAAVVVGLVLGGGVALAQWSAVGSGAGGLQAGAPSEIVVSGGHAVADLYPGATGDLAVELDNPNPYAVRFTGVQGGAVTPSSASCPDGVVTLVDGPVDVLVPAGAQGQTAVLDDVVRMDRSAPDGCQGATFAIEVTLVGAQA